MGRHPYLVTGANGLLTSAIARLLFQLGPPPLLHYHRSTNRIGELFEAGPTLQADLRSSADRERLGGWAKRHAPLAGVVLGASSFEKTPFDTTTTEQISKVLELELGSHLDVTRRLSGLLADDGRLLFFSDVGTRLGWPSYPAYLAAKAGIEAAVKSLARSLGPRIVVCCIAPGSLKGAPPPPEGAIRERTPLGRAGTPDEVAGAVVRFLHLPPSVVQGQTLLIDGGRHLARDYS